MNMFKRLIFAMLLGFVVGSVIASLVAPGILTWYNIPGAGQALCNCEETVRSTIARLVQAQVVGAGIGVAVGVAATIVCGARLNRFCPPRVSTARQLSAQQRKPRSAVLVLGGAWNCWPAQARAD